MKILFAVLFTFVFSGSLATTMVDSIHLAIQYRDTAGTYIQIFSKDSNTLEELIDLIVFEFTDSMGISLKFIRVINASNIPEISNFAPGNYSIRTQFYTYKNVEIKRNKVNVLTFLNPQASLGFAYVDDRHSMVLNQAMVTKKFCAENCTFKQHCNVIQMYPPGEYKIEINTMPPTIFSIQLDYCSRYELRIPKPCKFIVNDLTGVDSVVLYFHQGEDWRLCKVIDSVYRKDNPLLVQPRTYLLVWKRKGIVYEKKITLSEEKTYYCLFNTWD